MDQNTWFPTPLLLTAFAVFSAISVGACSSCSSDEPQTTNEPIDPGTPVVLAIRKYRKDIGSLPPSLEILVELGYLPRYWDEGFGSLPDEEEEFVRGKTWDKFLLYKPGADEDWTKDGWLSGSPDIMSETFGLAFIGLDGRVGTSDDRACSQRADLYFNLGTLFNEATRVRADLGAQAILLVKRSITMKEQVPIRQSRLESAKVSLQERMEAKGLTTFDQLKQDTVASRILLLIGELEMSKKRLAKQLDRLDDTIALITTEMSRFDNLQAEQRSAANSEDVARLTVLLEDAKGLLVEDSETVQLDDLEKLSAAEDWYRSSFEK